MVVAVIADTHGRLSSIINAVNLSKCDLVILLGDIYQVELNMINEIANVPIIGVYGNHDNSGMFDSTNIQNIHKKMYRQDRINFCGFQGSIKYKTNQEFGYTQVESIKECLDLSQCDIFICHDGPFGYCAKDDAHCGLKGIHKYIKKRQPKTVFFGHHHKNRHFMIGKTDCYNVYGISIFSIENGKVIDINKVLS